MTDQSEKIALFDDDEEVEDNDDFKVRPQYEGPRGQQLLELNSELSERFKLDERFAEDWEFEDEKGEKKDVPEENDEKIRNIKILETVLGHEITAKAENKAFMKKKQIRFDPDDENASKLIKLQETTLEKPKKTKAKKVVVEDKVEPEIPVSTERYIEVCPNLKEILNTAVPFSFSQAFNNDIEENGNLFQNGEKSVRKIDEEDTQKFEKKTRSEINPQKKLSTEYFTPKTKYESFFISKGDPRLKEGLQFFRRSNNVDEIKEWQKKRDYVLELFRKRKRSSQRSHSTRVQSTQFKNSIRRNNFKT